MSWHQIQKIFPGLLNISAKFEEIPSTSKDAIGRQTCEAGGYGGAGRPFHENSSHMQTCVPRGTLNHTPIPIHQQEYTNTNTPTGETLWWWSKKVTKIKIGFRGVETEQKPLFQTVVNNTLKRNHDFICHDLEGDIS